MTKKGNSIISVPLMLIISIFIIIFVGVYIINILIPFIYHQKLNTISEKYMYVIEKFGYLTNVEKKLLDEELINSGFDISRIKINVPDDTKEYGELITFEISYSLILKVPDLSEGKYNFKEKETVISIRKNSFSKL